MRVFTYSEARQKLASLLNLALTEEVIISKKDGTQFKLVPIKTNEKKSPLDVPGVKSSVKTPEILEIVRETREFDRNSSY